MQELQAAALTMMMSSVNAGDAKTYARLYAPNAIIRIVGGAELKGRDAIEQYEVDLLREYPGVRLAFYAAWQQGTLAVVRYGVNGKTAGGQPMGHEGLLFFRFDAAGLIAEERRYNDSMTPMAQLGAFGLKDARPLPVLPDRMATAGVPASDATVMTARALVKAFDTKDKAAFVAALRDDAVIDELVLREPFAGKANATRWLDLWRTVAPDARVEITNLVAVGDAVFVEEIVRGTLRGSLGPVSASGVPFTVHRALVIEITDGKLARLSAFMNAKELAESVGTWPPR